MYISATIPDYIKVNIMKKNLPFHMVFIRVILYTAQHKQKLFSDQLSRRYNLVKYSDRRKAEDCTEPGGKKL